MRKGKKPLRRRLIQFPIATKLLGTYLAAVIPLTVIIAIALGLYYQHQLNSAFGDRRNVAAASRVTFVNFLEELSDDQASAGQSIVQLGFMPQQTIHHMELVRDRHPINELQFLNNEGVVLFSTERGSVGQNLRGEVDVRAVLGGKDNAVGNLRKGSLHFPLSTAIIGPAGLQAIVRSKIEPLELDEVLPLKLVGGGSIVITDSTGTVVYSNVFPKLSLEQRKKGRGISTIKRALRGKEASGYVVRPPDDKPVMGVQLPIKEIGWTVGSYIENEKVLGPLRRNIFLSGIGVLLVITFSFSLSFGLGRILSAPLNVLTKKAKDLGEGKLGEEVPAAETGDEIELLSHSLERTRQELKDAFTEIQETAEEEKERVRRLNILRKVARAASSSFEVGALCQQTLDVIVGALDLTKGYIPLADYEKNRMEIVAHKNLAPDFISRNKYFSLDERYGSVEVLKTGKPIIIEDKNKVKLPSKTAGLLEQVPDIRGLVILPLPSRKLPLGTLVLGSTHPLKVSSEEQRFLEAIADTLAVGIKNAQLFQGQQKIAYLLQRSLFPKAIPKIEGLEIGLHYESATKEAAIGGDFYDIINLPGGKYGIVVGDVSGKGIESASDTAKVKYILRGFALDELEPREVISSLNRWLYKQTPSGEFVTLIYALFDPRSKRISYVNAGHPLPLIFDKQQQFLDETELALGVSPIEEYRQVSLNLKKGDILVIYTDGLMEARRDSDLFGENNISKVVADNKEKSPQEISEILGNEARNYARGVLTDDLLVLILKVL